MYEARDMALLVLMANFAIANLGRMLDWVHNASQSYLRSEDDRLFRPVAELDPRGARIFLGIVLPMYGASGLKRRHATASTYLSDFGVVLYCGLGRHAGEDGMETMREHRRVVDQLRL